MKLATAMSRYVTYKQSIGLNFETSAAILRALLRQVGENTSIRQVTKQEVLGYLNGSGPVTEWWHSKYGALKCFWAYSMQHGWTTCSPLPECAPQHPPRFVPYIYSRQELRRLLDGIATSQEKIYELERSTFRVILLLLYGAGLRIGEALRLTCADVDLEQGLLTIRLSKFYKTRMVAISPQLRTLLADYAMERKRSGHSRHKETPFFASRRDRPLDCQTIDYAFKKLRMHVGIRRTDGASEQPRLHDLRHTFAVHRLLAWYRSNANVQDLLPSLSTHLGHLNLSSTERYLTMTPELLTEASLRFEKYMLEGCDA